MSGALGKNLHPMTPPKWDTRHLQKFHVLHAHLDSEAARNAPEVQRKQLEMLVTTNLHDFYAQSDAAANPVAPCDVLSAPPGELLRRRTHAEGAALLRAHPEKLRAVIDIGLSSMDEARLRACCERDQMPPLEWWLTFMMDEATCRALVLEEPSRVCGRTLSSQEAIAYCLECASDDSCVLCAACFRDSPCRNHKHVVRYGGGNGICDCGDPGAWNPDSFCPRHKGFSENDDPTAAMDSGKKKWLQVVLRGLIFYQTQIIQALFLWSKNSEKMKDECHVARWLDRALRRVAAVTLRLANTGDCTRRLVNLVLMEKAFWFHPITASTVDVSKNDNSNNQTTAQTVSSSPLEEIFLANVEFDYREDFIIWDASLVYLFDVCLCDPLLRVPVAELLLKYGERLFLRKERHVSDLSVQVFTAKRVVDALLQRTPHPHWESLLGHETILHRLLSILLHMCCHIQKDRKNVSELGRVGFACCHWLEEMMCASENCNMMLASRFLFRAWYKVLCMVGCSSEVRYSVGVSPLNELDVWKDFAMSIESALHYVFYLAGNMVHRIGTALLMGDSAPIPNWMQASVRSFSSSWGAIPDPMAEYPLHRYVLDELAVSNESPLLFCCADTVEPNAEGREKRPHRTYMREVLKEAVKPINSTLEKVRSGSGEQIVLASRNNTGCGLPRYNLLDAEHPDPVSFVKPHMRFFVVLVEMWARLLRQEQQQQSEHANEEKCYPHVMTTMKDCAHTAGCMNGEEESFHALVLEVFAATGSRADYWLDECLMPIVLLAQAERGLWGPHDEDVRVRCRLYTSSVHSELDTDVYLLQLLLLLLPTEAYAVQVLQRHVLENRAKKTDLLSSQFLRFILTLCLTEWNTAIYDESDLKRVLRKRVVCGILTIHEYVFSLMEATALELKNVISSVDPKELLPSIVKENTVSKSRLCGHVFELKDIATWKANVSLYNPHIRDSHVVDLYETYERLSRQERMAQKRGHEMPTTSQEPEIVLPLPDFPWLQADQQQQQQRAAAGCGMAFQQRVYLLLQTPAVLSVAISVVHRYVHQVNGKVKEDAPGVLTNLDLTHAVTVLYLSMRACQLISSSMATMGALEGDDDGDVVVDWQSVKAFQEQFMQPCDYSQKSLEELFPVRDIMRAQTLKEKLELKLDFSASSAFILRTSEERGVTTIAALLQLCDVFKEPGKNAYGVAQMTRHVLRGVGALPASHFLAGETEEELRHKERVNQRRRCLKERQIALLKRVKTRDDKKFLGISQLPDAAVGAGEATAATCGNGSATGGASTPGESEIAAPPSVIMTLLLRLADVECCMCRDRSSEPLMLLTNTSTSDALYRLSHDTSSTTPNTKDCALNAHVYACGHVAHKKCVAKIFGRIARIMTGMDFSLNVAAIDRMHELRCPVCLMICTTLCPVPTLSNASVSREFSSQISLSSLFEDVRSETLKLNRTQPDLHQSLARAAVGICERRSSTDSAPAHHSKAHLLAEPSELQLKRPSMWALVETLRAIRSHVYVALEWVKAGGEVRYNELLTLFALMVSLDPNTLSTSASTLKGELNRNGDALCLLLLTLLQTPSEATVLFASYTKLLLVSSDHTTLVAPSVGKGNDTYARLLIAMWKELGSLTLLKAMILDSSPAEVVRCNDGAVSLTPLSPENLDTLEGQQRAVLTMLCYLLELPFDSLRMGEPQAALASLVQTVVTDVGTHPNKDPWWNALPPAELMCCKAHPALYEGPSLWRRHIARHVFHLCDTIGEALLNLSSQERCSVCGDAEAQRVQCCFCGRSLCARPVLSPPELYDHARTCGRGLGVYLNPFQFSLAVLLTIQDSHVRFGGLYTDEYGQSEKHRLRGHTAALSDEMVKLFLSLWMRSRWEVESVIVKRLARYNVQRI